MAILNWLKKAGKVFSGGEKKVSEDGRDQWPNRAAFLLASVGGAIGQGNIIRYPSQVFNNIGEPSLICKRRVCHLSMLTSDTHRPTMVHPIPYGHLHLGDPWSDLGSLPRPGIPWWNRSSPEPSQSPRKRRRTGLSLRQRGGGRLFCNHPGGSLSAQDRCPCMLTSFSAGS